MRPKKHHWLTYKLVFNDVFIYSWSGLTTWAFIKPIFFYLNAFSVNRLKAYEIEMNIYVWKQMYV